LPPLPIPAAVDRRRRRFFVEFGKRAIDVQLAAEHVAVIASHHLLLYADGRAMHPAVRRALAAVCNDEASHVAVMVELQVRADAAYPDVPSQPRASPLFGAFIDAIPKLHPAVVSIFMGAYEAMIAIRAYTEEASYRYPSILGRIASRAAHDDALHAKVMRLVSHVLLDELRAEATESNAIQRHVVEPLRVFWPLLIDHERFLLRDERRSQAEWQRRVVADAAILGRILTVVGITEFEQNSVELLKTATARFGA
jgi:hypothetical protein